MRDEIFEACLFYIEREGWKNFSAAKASQASGLPVEGFSTYFPHPSEVMVYLFQRLDKEVLQALPLPSSLSPKDTLFEILMTRFEAAQPYKKVMCLFYQEWFYTLKETPAIACQGLSSLSWILEASGLSSRGLKGLVRLQGLTGLYLLTLKTWFEDNSPDLGKTMAVLDKGLSQLEDWASYMTFL